MNNFSIINQLNDTQIHQLHELFKKTWWANNRTMEEILTMLQNSISFGVIENQSNALVGYARVLTDQIKYAFIFDVIAVEQHRGKGLGKMLMHTIIAHPHLKDVKNFELTCAPDMVSYYEQFGFSENYGPKAKPMRFSRNF